MMVNERTSAHIAVEFRDRFGALVVPINIQYRVDCRTTLTSLVPLTSVAAASTLTIHVTSTQNRIIERSNVQEDRVVTVTADYGSDHMVVQQYDYTVRNLQFVD